MKYIVRTLKEGQRQPLKDVEEKRKLLKEKILKSGWQYLETETFMGSFNGLGERIEEKVYLIEVVSEVTFI